ncbi:MAG: hypothetical protein IKW30_09930 [Lachnospiraceae bacterium]|nr:hypothetical protein [Lachnospiraceae bacterium]
MKKHNFIFLGECAIIVVILALIAVLVRDEKKEYFASENVTAVVEVSEESDGLETVETMVAEENLSVATAEEEVSGADFEEEKTKPEQLRTEESENKDDKVKIVVFGDSIWADGRGKDGICEQVMEQLKDVEFYNCAIGGTAAALEEVQGLDNWDSRSFNGMMYIATDLIPAEDLIAQDAAYEVMKTVDFNEMDYVIVSYGINDYFSDITIYPQEYYDLTSYVGALRHGISKMQKKYPHLEFIITSPTYTGWFSGERQFELGEYVEAARSVAAEMDTHFLDMYHAFGKTADEKTEYLDDGVHLTAEGRWLYSRSVIDCLKELEKEE